MDSVEFRKLMNDHIDKMVGSAKSLFIIDIDKDYLYQLYLDSFPVGTNEIYRKRRVYDCGCCKNFIRNFGNVVSINKNYEVITIWDFDVNNDPTFKPVNDAMSKYVNSKLVSDVFITKLPNLIIKISYEKINDKVIEYDHFFYKLPTKFINNSSKSEESVMAEFRDVKNVFKRALDEFTKDTIMTVLDLMAQKSLYRGEEFEPVVKIFYDIKMEYDKLSNSFKKDNYTWIKSIEVGPSIAKIRNMAIGTLLVDIEKGVDLEEAVRKYESVMAPANYKRPKPVYTASMIEKAKEEVEKLGYTRSLDRRLANLDDISANNVLYSNIDASNRIKKPTDVFGELAENLPVKPTNNKLAKEAEVTIDEFIQKILPTATNIEVYLENKHFINMVSLITAKNPDAPSMFKWNNPFSWAYTGNIADSNMKSLVKSFGGKIDGVLRFSIQWNDNNDNRNDFDAHCTEPSGNHISFMNMKNPRTTGMLDVDNRNPGSKVAVENITWSDIDMMREGIYTFSVHNFNHRGGRSGFSAEIEYNGELYSFSYPYELKSNQTVQVAKVNYSKKDGFSIIESLDSRNITSTKEMWNLKSNKFHPVSAIMFSPNYWDAMTGVGNKHYFFMLKDCINKESPNGFYNEFLNNELTTHRKVFGALGASKKVESVDDQLSGLGFSSTKSDSLLVKVDGRFSRTIRVKFN